MSITIGVGVQNTGYTNTNNTTKKTETAKTTAAAETKNSAATTATNAEANTTVVQTNATGDTLEVTNTATNTAADKTSNKTEKKQVDEKELAKLLAESQQEAKQFMNFMNKVLRNQGKQDSISKANGNKEDNSNDMASILGIGNEVSFEDMQNTVADLKAGLENGTLQVSQEDIDKAKELTSEDGYYGVKQTSARIVDFAKAISGGDTSKAEMLREAAQKGFEQAAELWGGMEKAPQITKDTYAAVMKGFDDWVGGSTAA